MGDDYSFLQEKIKDEAGNPKRLRKKIFRMILLGFIFGITACLTFFAFRPWLEGFLGQNVEEVSIPEDEITEPDEETETAEEIPAETEEQIQKRLLKTLQNTAKDIRPGVVLVSGQKNLEEDAKDQKTSGVIIADNGSEMLILSRVFEQKSMKRAEVTFADGCEYEATWKMYDPNLGIGICAVNKDHITQETWVQIETVRLGNSFQAEIGEPAIAMGISSEEDLKISFGFLASGDEKIEIADGNIDLLRTDVAGATFDNGMIFNQDGALIGIVNVENIENQTHVMAYSISDIKKEIEYMSNGNPIPYIGIWGVMLPDEIKAEGLEEGICVQEIDTDSPAMEAGIQCGDVITQVENTKVSNMNEYRAALLNENMEDGVVLTGLRKGADDQYVEMTFKITGSKTLMTD